MSLIQAIDAFTAYIGAFRVREIDGALVSYRVSFEELERIKELDLSVWLAAKHLGFTDDDFPKLEDLKHAWEFPELPKACYVGKTRLPYELVGKWYCLYPRGRWESDIAALRALAARKVETPHQAEANKPGLVVDINRRTITVEEQTFDVTSEKALRWIKVLSDHPGEWISSAQLENYDDELIGCRTDRLRDFLPKKALKLIDSETGKGSRLRMA